MFRSLSVSASAGSSSAFGSMRSTGPGSKAFVGKNPSEELHPNKKVTAVRVYLSELTEGDAPLTGLKYAAGSAAMVVAGLALIPAAVGAVATAPEDAKGAVIENTENVLQQAARGVVRMTNTLSHFLMEIDLGEDLTCTLEFTADVGILFVMGASERESKCCTYEPRFPTGLMLKHVTEFIEYQRRFEYNMHHNNCKHFVYKFLKSVLNDNDFVDYKSFRDQMQREFH